VITEEQALEKILSRIQPLPSRRAALSDAAGFFAARDIMARLALPLFDNSAMDGYAVIASDCTPGKSLRVAGEQPAGLDRKLRVKKGEAIRIFTGAPLPDGADAVVMQEDVTRNSDQIVLHEKVKAGEFIRRRGCDLSEGQKIVEAGELLRAENLALLASQGMAEVEIGGQARVAIISTGDELVPPGSPLRAGELYESNSTLLRALVERTRAVPEFVRHVPDNPNELEAALLEGTKHDVLIISGGVSVGEHDLVRPTLRAIGAEIDLWRVALKPGKPFLFGHRVRSPSPQSSPSGRERRTRSADEGAASPRACFVFALPGNPVSSFVTFLVFVRAAILRMMGANDAARSLAKTTARLASDVNNDGGRAHYLRGVLRDGEFTPIGRQESHALYGLSRSNALLHLAAGEKLSAGAMASVFPWT
jgi:molybdopterin molybdotransferase